jgi:hypothetical protein
MVDMTLLDDVLAAYGGADRWKQIDTITIHQLVGGVLWPLKEVGGILDDSIVEIAVQHERTRHWPLPEPGLHSEFTPDLVLIKRDDTDETVDTLADPRASFAGHTLETPWSTQQLAYFSGYAMWTYLSEPYSLTFPGVVTEELGDWRENGQTWRRLGVRYPDGIATHSADQMLYVDSDGLVRRRDYQVDIGGGSAAAHYSDDHREFDGIVLPVTRRVYPRDDNRRPVSEPLLVSIDIDDVTVR